MWRATSKKHMLMAFAKITAAGLLLIVCAASQVSVEAQSSSTAQPMGRVKGTALDFNEARILGLTIVFEGQQIKKEVISDKLGTYEVELPAGIYRIDIPDIYDYYFPFRRAAFRVQPGIETMINVVPVGYHILGADPGPDRPIKNFPTGDETAPRKYNSYVPSNTSNPQLDLVIRYYERRKRRGIIDYRKATASYDALTIYADKLRLDPKTYRLEAEGNVIVEDGKQRLHVKRAEVTFTAGEPILNLTK